MTTVLTLWGALAWAGYHWQAIAIAAIGFGVARAAVEIWRARPRKRARVPVKSSVPPSGRTPNPWN